MTDQPVKSESTPALYFCPGESYPISPAVHYARLAAFYPKCRSCPLRQHEGHLLPETVQLDIDIHPERKTLVTPAGLRGVYLNEINRLQASALANAYITLLMQGLFSPKPTGQPTIVIGYQEHLASPDLMIGVVNALRATGVSIVDLGLTIAPELSFAIQECEAAGGMIVTGAGGDPAWIGFDFLTAHGQTIHDADLLMQIETAQTLPTFRLTHANGTYRTWDVEADYESSLKLLFHALRPLRIGLATPLKRVNELAERLFEPLPCSLELLPLPHRKRDLADPEDRDVLKLGEFIRTRSLHLGVVVDSDGRSTALLNDEGCLIPRDQWQTWLQQGSAIEQFSSQKNSARLNHSNVFESDAMITLAVILSEMSRSDAQLSEHLWVD